MTQINGLQNCLSAIQQDMSNTQDALDDKADLSGATFTGDISATNLSGSNTGDETGTTIKTKLGAATTSVDGYLTSTDWNTFNGKQNTLTAGTNITIVDNVISSSGGGGGGGLLLTATSSTAAATADKVASLTGFTLETGKNFFINFANGNSVAGALTVNVESTGVLTVYHQGGTAVSATAPAYFPANVPIEFWYDGTGLRFRNEIVKEYVSGASWYNVRSNGWVEQGGTLQSSASSITLPVEMADTSYQYIAQAQSAGNFYNLSATRNTTGLTSCAEIYGTSSTHATHSYWSPGTQWEVKGYTA